MEYPTPTVNIFVPLPSPCIGGFLLGDGAVMLANAACAKLIPSEVMGGNTLWLKSGRFIL